MNDTTEQQIEIPGSSTDAAEQAAGTGAQAEQQQPDAATGETEGEHSEQKKRDGGFQRRIDRLTRELRQTQAQLQSVQTQAKPAPADDGAPDPSKFAYGENDPAYIRQAAIAEARREARAELAREREAEQRQKTEAEQAKQAQTWAKRLDAVRDEIDDFDDVVGSASVALSPTMHAALLESDVGPKLAYHLASHPAEAERIAALPSWRQGAAMEKLEAEIAKPKAKPSAAPAPVQPLKGRAPTSDAPSDTDDINTWMAKEAARTARRR